MTQSAIDDIPPYGSVCYGEREAAPHDRPAAIRRRTIAAIEQSLHSLLVAIARDYERCGKAACARSRRCRGFACERDRADEADLD